MQTCATIDRGGRTMELQKLTIHNIASFEDAEIDFGKQPLVDSDVFLITGKTGAGKSTILDAICLALYAQTPRLDSTKMQGEANDGDNTVKIDDTRQLMRRNTGEAFVSLTFIGSNGVHYEAIWSVARAFKKATGKMQPKSWQLKNIDTSETLKKEKEIEAEIKAAVGLDFNQFCRTTMLPQGEFTRFLNSTDNEKAEILEKITGVDIYSRIGAKVFAVTGQKEQTWKEAKRLVEGCRTLTEAEIAGEKKQIAELDSMLEKLKADSKTDSDKRDWIRLDERMAKSVTDAETALQKAKDATQSEESKTKERRIKDWRDTIEARGWMSEIQKADDEQKAQQQKQKRLAEDYARLLGGKLHAENEAKKIGERLEKVGKLIGDEANKAVVYENEQTIRGHLTTVSMGRDFITRQKGAIAKAEKQLTDTLSPAFEKAKQDAVAARTKTKEYEALVKEQEKAVEEMHLPALRNEQNEAKTLVDKTDKAIERIGTLDEAKRRHAGKRLSLDEQSAAIKAKKDESDRMETSINDARIKMETCKENLDRQKDTVNKLAVSMRAKLHEGDTCPVCGQKIVAALPHEELLEELVKGLHDEYDKAEAAHRKLVDSKKTLDAEAKAISAGYRRELKAFSEDESVQQAIGKAMEACRACGIEALDEGTMSVLQQLKEKEESAYETLAARIKEGEAKESIARQLRKTLEDTRNASDALAETAKEAEEAVIACKGRIDTTKQLIEAKASEVGKAEKEVADLLTAGDWTVDWEKEPQVFAETLKIAAKAYRQHVDEQQRLNRQLENHHTNSNNVDAVVGRIRQTVPEWEGVAAGPVNEIPNLLDEANHIANQITVVTTQLHGAEERHKGNSKKLKEFMDVNPSMSTDRLTELSAFTDSAIAKAEAELRQQGNAELAAKTTLDNSVKQLEEHRQHKPELTDDDTMESLTARIDGYAAQMSAADQRKGSIKQELRADDERKTELGTLIKDADDKKADYEKWSHLNGLIGDATGNKFRKIAQSYVLSSLIHSANSYMKTLTDRYTLKVTPGTFVISIEDAYQGFASRAASTISGGESFLVSLSLALALSDIGQTLSVDTLFIDEGFGTLSGEPLQNAIDTLRSLHTKAGRHIGIISHVEELQEKIPVQVHVCQDNKSSCSIIRFVPDVTGKASAQASFAGTCGGA